MSQDGLHAADDEIWRQKKGYMLYMMLYGVRGVHSADDEMWCHKDYMLQIIIKMFFV